MDYTVLKSEVDTDPLARGYAGMTDHQVADSLNTEDRSAVRETVMSAELFEVLDIGEYQSLPTVQQHAVDLILGLGEGIRVGSGNARDVLLSLFGPGTSTRTGLQSLAQMLISRAVELGLRRIWALDVTRVRAV